MKLTLSWLKDHLDTNASLDQIVERLTAIGLEVEHVDDKAVLKPFVIAKVLSAEKHPDADKLQVLSVDIGSGDPIQVVCGAPNARAGRRLSARAGCWNSTAARRYCSAAWAWSSRKHRPRSWTSPGLVLRPAG